MTRLLLSMSLVFASCERQEDVPGSSRGEDENQNPGIAQPAFWEDDDVLREHLVGRWLKDETYYYGRFIGTATFEADGQCERRYSVYEDDGVTLNPLIVERGRWRVEIGYVWFYDVLVEGLESGEPDYQVKKSTPDQREWVMQLNAEELKTVDEENKIDAYERIE